MMEATNIIWETDGEDIALPNRIKIPDGMTDEDEISDYISDQTGFCHKGFYLEPSSFESILWDVLLDHCGHNVQIVKYGDPDDPADVCLECEDCGETILDAKLYTLCAREEW